MKQTKDGIPVVTLDELKDLKNTMDNKNVKKGILLIGDPGVGKTTTVEEWLFYEAGEALHQLEEKYKDHTPYQIELKKQYFLPDTNLVSTTNIVDAYMQSGKILEPKNIDDLGTERPANYYGTTMDLIPHIIQRKYERGEEFGYYTTNLSLSELKDRYGIRIVDRLIERCWVFVIQDVNHRRVTTINDIKEVLK